MLSRLHAHTHRYRSCILTHTHRERPQLESLWRQPLLWLPLLLPTSSLELPIDRESFLVLPGCTKTPLLRISRFACLVGCGSNRYIIFVVAATAVGLRFFAPLSTCAKIYTKEFENTLIIKRKETRITTTKRNKIHILFKLCVSLSSRLVCPTVHLFCVCSMRIFVFLHSPAAILFLAI